MHSVEQPMIVKPSTAAMRVTELRPPPEGRWAAASSFFDDESASAAVAEVIDSNRDTIAKWLDTPSRFALVLDGRCVHPVGRYVDRADFQVVDAAGVRVILDKSDPGPPGYRIVTSFPTAGPCPAPPAPALGVLLQAYLHPDWLETDDDCWGVLARFIDVEPAAALEARSEFAALPGFVSDEELDGYLIDQLGSWWIPSGQDWTSREWLSALQLMLGGPVPSP